MPSDDPKLLAEDEFARKRGVERDYIGEILTSRRTAWRVAIAAGLLALTSSGAVIGLAPLKEPPQLYVVRVDHATGNVENVTVLADAQESYGERLDRYFIQEYVDACESYDWYTIQNMYDRCALFSSTDTQKAYYEKFKGEKGWDKIYANHTRLRTMVNTITLGPNGSATVRFTRQMENNAQQPIAPPERLLATLAYSYVNVDLSEKVGRKNPLGFQVVSYETDVEVGAK